MNSSDQLLRETFSHEAETVTMAPYLRAGIDSRARRYRIRRTAIAAASVLAVVALGVAAPLAIRAGDDRGVTAPAEQPALTDHESWQPRGALAADDAFIRRAVAAWDEHSDPAYGGTHTQVRVLWADEFETGRAVVLTAKDGLGNRRLAVVAGRGDHLKPIRDLPAPKTLTHLSLNLFIGDTISNARGYRDTLVVLMPPGTDWLVEWTGGDESAYGGGVAAAPAAADGVAVIDISGAGPTGRPRIRIRDGDRTVYDGPIGTMS